MKPTSRAKQLSDLLFLLGGIGIAVLFTTRYLMAFRLDDVLLMEWATKHPALDAFDPIQGQIVNSVRPIYALTAYVLTHLAGWAHPFWWQLTLTVSLLIGLTFTGLTARYLAERWFALQISIGLYWIAFTAILNVFFWYSDLTFGLELAFTAPAWYFGLRGLYEARLKFWLLAMASGSLAVMSKEPALVLVHVVLIGSLALERHSIFAEWKSKSKTVKWAAIAGYATLSIVTLYIILVSPTRTNRFVPFSDPNIASLIRERLSYYSGIYLNVAPRIFLCFPILYAATSSFLYLRFGNGLIIFLLVNAIAAAITLSCCSNILFALPLLVFALTALAVYPNPEMQRVRRLLPFLACILLATATLLITIQVVKTQLTEIAMLSIILAGWAWCVWGEDFHTALHSPTISPPIRKLILTALVLGESFSIVGFIPKLSRQEHLLREARDVRRNANEALAWAAASLPKNAVFATGLYSLYGKDHLASITAMDDSTKLREQYTFDGGFVYHVFEILGRWDIRHAYLEDTVMVPRVLDAMRDDPNAYLFLQSDLDRRFFHGITPSHPNLLGAHDSLIGQFNRGSYPCEIWLMRR